MDSIGRDLASEYQHVDSSSALGYPLVPILQNESYLDWPLLPELFMVSFPGVKTSRDDVLVDIDRDRLVSRMETYFDPGHSNAEMELLIPGVMDATKRFNADAVRSQLVKRGFLPDNIIRYAYRPFDVRWLYWEPMTKLLDEKREEYLPHVSAENVWLEARQRLPQDLFDRGMVSVSLGDQIGNGMSSWFPLIARAHKGASPFRDNLSSLAKGYLQDLKQEQHVLFFHALATMHSSIYRTENGGALRQDWPRIPLPTDGEKLATSAELGRHLAILLDIEKDAPGISSGTIRPELRTIAVPSHVGGGNIDPDSADLAVTAGWGRGGNGKPVMPGRGRVVERDVRAEELNALGALTIDVHLNAEVYWQNVPKRVWDYSLGGYQVLKKWLSYREDSVLGRRLHVDEVRTFTQIARRVAAILMMEEALDASYLACSAGTWDWKAAVDAANPQRSLFPGLI